MKKDLVNSKSLYIHMDNVINNVVTSGINFYDFISSVTAPLENILLLKHQLKDVSYNAHTAFDYLDQKDLNKLRGEQSKKFSDFCWIDFEDVDLLNQLSPQEVAELLYLAHTGRHLRSQFYYKLQNNFVYLTKEDGRYNKIYYRHMNQFYLLLAAVIMKRAGEIMNEKSLFAFGKRRKVSELPVSLLKKMEEHFKEGVCIDFLAAEKTRTQFEIPIGTDLTDELEALEESDESVRYNIVKAYLVYDLKQAEWVYKEN